MNIKQKEAQKASFFFSVFVYIKEVPVFRKTGNRQEKKSVNVYTA